MFLIVGLGNPGANYASTRHNAGFIFLDYLVHQYNVTWKEKNKFGSLLADVKFAGLDTMLCKPQSFMNLSGNCVLALSSYYKIKPEQIIVVHDDLDFPLGKVMYKLGGGAGGHNGLKSIDKAIGPNYHRVRIGIGRPKDERQEVADFVLQNFRHEEFLILSEVVEFLGEKISLLLENKIDDFKHALSKFLP
jgi:PTH1 family peptidyl-tRNA hydrolase